MRDTSSLYLSVGVLIVILYSNTGVGYDLEGSVRDGGGVFINGQQRFNISNRYTINSVNHYNYNSHHSIASNAPSSVSHEVVNATAIRVSWSITGSVSGFVIYTISSGLDTVTEQLN